MQLTFYCCPVTLLRGITCKSECLTVIQSSYLLCASTFREQTTLPSLPISSHRWQTQWPLFTTRSSTRTTTTKPDLSPTTSCGTYGEPSCRAWAGTAVTMTWTCISTSQSPTVCFFSSRNPRVTHAVTSVLLSTTTEQAWLSVLIIDALHQGRGMGRELLNAAMLDFEFMETETVGLDAPAERKVVFKRRGFVDSPVGTVNITTWRLTSQQSILPERDKKQSRMVSISAVPCELLALHEHRCTGFHRPMF